MEDFTFDSTITVSTRFSYCIQNIAVAALMQRVPQRNDTDQFQWQGPPVYHVVAGLHTFEFKPSINTPGGTTFIQKEEYSGPLAFLMSPSLVGKKIMGQFNKFNEDLKLRAEKK